MKRLVSLCLSLVMCFGFLMSVPMKAEAATWEDINQGDVFLKQAESNSCTLCAAAMLCRRVAIMDGRDNWRSISEGALKGVMNWDDGLSWDFTYEGIRIVHSGGRYALADTNKADKLRDVLSRCPEGIVAYDRDRPHAVLLTDYSDGTFYCADPANSKPGGRIPISSALISLESIDDYWYCSSPLVYIEPTPAPVYPDIPSLSVSAGTSESPVGFSWNACANADWYDVRIYKSDDTNIVTEMGIKGQSYSYSLSPGSYYANVASVNANGNYMVSSNVPFTVAEPPKYPDKPVVTVEASDTSHPVVVSYNACANTTDYCIRYYDAKDKLVYAIGDSDDSIKFGNGADYTETSHSYSLPAGTYKVTVAAINDKDGVWTFSEPVSFTVSAVKRGDVNDDGSIDLKDVTFMRRALAGWDVEINEAAADINLDDSFDLKDVVYLRRFLAGGWGFDLNKTALTLNTGDTYQLTTNYLDPDALIWMTSSPGVVEVSADGLVTATKTGSATISVTANGDTAYCKVTVVAETQDK